MSRQSDGTGIVERLVDLLDSDQGPLPGAPGGAIEEIIEWLAGDECQGLDDAGLARGLGQRLRAAGVPVERLTLHVRTVHPDLVARSVTWSAGDASGLRRPQDGAEVRQRSGTDVLRGEWETVALPTASLDGASHRPEAHVDASGNKGVVQSIDLPLRNADGQVNAVTFATWASGGFSSLDRIILDRVQPALRNACELLAHRTAELALLETYVGARTARRVLAGHVRRGEFEALDAGLLLCDLRGFTELSNHLPGELVLELLNEYFDRVVPAITDAGGEVIKFMGDAALAFFHTDDAAASCTAALGGALRALEGVDAINAVVKLRAGVALHYGKVGYGNIGSGRRLDFTVIGRDVNLVSRIQGVCSTTGVPLLMSSRFASLIAPSKATAMGSYGLPGFDAPTELYTLPDLFPRTATTAATNATLCTTRVGNR
jgi:adenylate cyclase